MGALEETEVLGLATEHVGGGGEQLEVLGSKRIGPVGSRQRLVRIRPGLGRICLTSPLKVGYGSHYVGNYRSPLRVPCSGQSSYPRGLA